MDRNVYESLELRVARHSSETTEYLLVRIRFVTIPRAGHLFHLERPDIAIDVFSEFLADVERPAPALAPGPGPRKAIDVRAPNVDGRSVS